MRSKQNFPKFELGNCFEFQNIISDHPSTPERRSTPERHYHALHTKMTHLLVNPLVAQVS